MTQLSLLSLGMAQSGAPQSARQIVYEFARATSLEGWWVWALLLGSIAALLVLSARFYRRDVNELPATVGWTLIALRLVAIAGLIFFFFDLQRRTQRLVTRPSEVAVLVDTSQSMSLPADAAASGESRSQRVQRLLADTSMLEKLAKEHRVSVYTFDETSEARLIETRGNRAQGETDVESDETSSAAVPAARPWAWMGTLFVAAALLLSVISLLVGATGRSSIVGPILITTAVTLVLGIVSLGGAFTVATQTSLANLLGINQAGSSAQQATIDDDDDVSDTPELRVTDWGQEIAAAGAESRIGDAIRSVLGDHDPSTLAGIVLVTDGQNNGGTDSSVAIAAARRSAVTVYPVGLGSSTAPINVRVVDLDAPRRVYPGDKFAVTAVLQASGQKPLEVDVQLLDGLDSGEASPGAGEIVDSQRVKVASDGTLTGIRFEIEPESVGQRRLAVRVVAPQEDQNAQDDLRDARYEVVSRKLRVLLIAGGPTREYRFVRNLLYRDESVELDAWLQTGQAGMSQDADKVLQSFPPNAEALFQYDAIALFDPDWMAISAESMNLLDRWLSQQAGGMIIVAGPVYHPQWTRLRTDPRVSKVAGFFPVNISTRGPLLVGGRQGGENAWPPKLTPEARRADFLWITGDPAESEQAWADFSGVYDYVGVRDPKPGAKVYAYFSDPTTEVGDSLPVYMASQFYGAGRVYFQGSGEMWRLRGESDSYFDSYYTKLLRWVSEGRLLRDSNRGVLLVDSSRAMVGDTITVRAVLTDEQFEPLDVTEVNAKLLAPGGRIDDIRLLPLKGEPRAGTYGGRFIVREAGSYEIRLTLGNALDEQVLRQNVQVRLPTVELERPKRNDDALLQVATLTGGRYMPMDPETQPANVATELIQLLRPQPQTTILPGTPDRDFTQRRNAVLMWLIASVLTMEWIVRRLHRLA
tara:strand:- start:79584 stop:82361 length:2778 start_codon:yes stop_codon:yes gene_type:complete